MDFDALVAVCRAFDNVFISCLFTSFEELGRVFKYRCCLPSNQAGCIRFNNVQ